MDWNKLRLVGATNVDLPLLGADAAGPFILKGVDGLGPPERVIFRGKTIDEGSIRQGKRTNDRSVVALIGLHPDWDTGQTASDLRKMLYGMLTTKYDQPLGVQVMLGSTVIAETWGDISRFEAAIFSKDPAVQMTIDTTFPYLVAPAAVEQNPVKYAVTPGITGFDITNDGDAPSGFWMSIVLTAGRTDPLVLTDDSANGQSMTISGTFAGGDTIIIDTRARSRGIWKIPSGGSALQSIIGQKSGADPWMQLHGGVNSMRLNDETFNWGAAPAGVVHTPAYWGV